MKQIIPGRTITVHFMGDSDLMPEIQVIARTPKTAIVLLDGKQIRCKIHSFKDYEYIHPYGKYSMSPIAY